MNEIKPIFRWAQSLNNIYIKTKYSHRLDAPTCEDVFDQKIKMKETYFNLTAKCRKDHEAQFYMLYLELYDRIDPKKSSWEKNETDGTIQITLQKKDWARWPFLFKNQGDDKPGKALLWVSKHLEYENSLDNWKDQNILPDEDGEKPPPDQFDRLVAHALKRKLVEPTPQFKATKGPTIEARDVTGEIHTEDITDQMKDKFNFQKLKDQMLNPNKGNVYDVEEELEEIERQKRMGVYPGEDDWDDSEEWGAEDDYYEFENPDDMPDDDILIEEDL